MTTVDLALPPRSKVWHIVHAHATECGASIADAPIERGVDARVVQFRSKRVCTRCIVNRRKRLTAEREVVAT